MFVRMKKKCLPFFFISRASQRSFSVKRVREMIKTRRNSSLNQFILNQFLQKSYREKFTCSK
jgi:hypothetical protein